MTIAFALTPNPPPLIRAQRLAQIFAETAAAHDAAASVPSENFRALFEAGLLGLCIPRAFGGPGGNIREAAETVGAIAQGEPATALILAMHYIHQRVAMRGAGWAPSLKDRLAHDMLERVSLVNALRVEPELGSPARGGLPETTAVRHGDYWRITGHKIYSTGAAILSWYFVWAKTDEAEPRTGYFLVPAGLPGISIVESWDHLGLRASGSHDVIFDSVTIPLDHAADIRSPEAWITADLSQQHFDSSVLLAALYDGIARAARDWTITFLKTRIPSNLGQPLARLPRSEDRTGALEMLLTANRLLLEALTSSDAGQRHREKDAQAVKSLVTNNAIQAVEIALSLAGNHGLTRKNPLERHYRDVLCGRVHTPQDDSVRLALGRQALA